LLHAARTGKLKNLERRSACFEADKFFEMLTEIMIRRNEFDLNNPRHSQLLTRIHTDHLLFIVPVHYCLTWRFKLGWHVNGGVQMNEVTVLSLGGSIIVPDEVDTQFLSRFYTAVSAYLSEDSSRRIIMVTGGGAPARRYQQAYRAISDQPDEHLQDWIGIAATHLNGTLLKAVFSQWCSTELVTDPTAPFDFDSQVLIAAGWKPGFSTDNDAVVLAERFGASRVINLSNIAKVYTDDPRTNPDAQPIDHTGWKQFREMVGDTWSPGKNVPFDPIAAKRASELGLEVICAAGANIENTIRILEHRDFEGTTIGPEL
jgi:uridylate kinase